MYKNYAELYKFIKAGRDKTRRTIANNTTARIEDDNIIITLHWTDIVTITPDDTKTFNAGRWHTVTTKERINRFMPAPFRLYQEDYSWYIWNYKTRERVCEFCNGLIITLEGEVIK